MATFSTTDDPVAEAEDWQSLPVEADTPALIEPVRNVQSPIDRIRVEIWQPRYLILAGIILFLILLQIWVLY